MLQGGQNGGGGGSPLWPFRLPMTVLKRMLAARGGGCPANAGGLAAVGLLDLLSFVFWITGFFGNTIEWRGRRYKLHADGTLTAIG